MEQLDTKLEVLEYETYGRLPELLKMNDGTDVCDARDWERRKKEIYQTAVELQYGKQPPAPDFLDVALLFQGKPWRTYRITTGTRKNPVSFTMRVGVPQTISAEEKFPVIVSGDLCFGLVYNRDYIEPPMNAGIGWAIFDRTELVPDNKEDGRNGPLYQAYPDYDFGAIGAWAWGYSRCVDALLKLDLIDPDFIIFTGHSRGGKTAMLAGVLDERASIVNPNETCAGACSCYRVRMTAVTDQGTVRRSEMLDDLMKNFGFWMGKGMYDYVGKPETLPFDEHFLKALVAPRTLYVSEAVHDIWANPLGSWQTTMAAGEAFKLLGVPENLYWYYRDGGHGQTEQDIKMLVNLILHKKEGTPLSDTFFRRPFDAPALLFDPQK